MPAWIPSIAVVSCALLLFHTIVVILNLRGAVLGQGTSPSSSSASASRAYAGRRARRRRRRPSTRWPPTPSSPTLTRPRSSWPSTGPPRRSSSARSTTRCPGSPARRGSRAASSARTSSSRSAGLLPSSAALVLASVVQSQDLLEPTVPFADIAHHTRPWLAGGQRRPGGPAPRQHGLPRQLLPDDLQDPEHLAAGRLRPAGGAGDPRTVKSNLVFFLGLFAALGDLLGRDRPRLERPAGRPRALLRRHPGQTPIPSGCPAWPPAASSSTGTSGCAACHTQQVRRPDFGSRPGARLGRPPERRPRLHLPAVPAARPFADRARPDEPRRTASRRRWTPTTSCTLLYTGAGGMPSYRFLFERRQIGAEAQPSDSALKLTGALKPKAGWEVVPTVAGDGLGRLPAQPEDDLRLSGGRSRCGSEGGGRGARRTRRGSGYGAGRPRHGSECARSGCRRPRDPGTWRCGARTRFDFAGASSVRWCSRRGCERAYSRGRRGFSDPSFYCSRP